MPESQHIAKMELLQIWQTRLGKAGSLHTGHCQWQWKERFDRERSLKQKNGSATFFQEIKKRFDKHDNLWQNGGHTVQLTPSGLCPHPLGIHFHVQKASYCEHLHLSVRSFVLVVSKLSCEHSCQRPQKQPLSSDGPWGGWAPQLLCPSYRISLRACLTSASSAVAAGYMWLLSI